MQIKDIGGEFALIKRITREAINKNVIVGIGDDCAIINVNNKYLAITTDSVIEDVHFSLKWFSPLQIGKKAIEINVSDISAMGGIPKYALLSLVLRRNIPLRFVDELYKGIYQSSGKYNINIIGGNTSHGSQTVIDVCMIGEVTKKNLCLRSYAMPGDYIFVTGEIGRASAGLCLLLNKVQGYEGLKKSFLEPKAQLEKSQVVARYSNAMIDLSDGFASEIWHICEQSKCGAILYKEKLPVSIETKNAVNSLGKDVYELALYGGEDFQLIFTVPPENIKKIRGAYLIGRITRKREVLLVSEGKKKKLKKNGYDHFVSE